MSVQYLVTVYYNVYDSHQLQFAAQEHYTPPAANRLFLLQKKAIRILFSRCRMEPCRPLFVDLGIMTLYSQNVLNSVSYVKKNMTHYATKGYVHGCITRNRNYINTPWARLRSVFLILWWSCICITPLTRKSEVCKLASLWMIYQSLKARPLWSWGRWVGLEALAMDEEMVMVLWLQVLCVTGAAVPDTCVVVPSCPSCRSSACLRHLPFQGSRTTLEVCMTSTSRARIAARLIFVIFARIEVYFYNFSKQFLVPICNKIHVWYEFG